MANENAVNFEDEAYANAAALFAGAGEVRSQARALDWSKSPLGSNRRLVTRAPNDGARRSSTLPFRSAFGRVRQYALVYNDAYRRILAAKHPAALGQPGSGVWAEIWDGS